MNCHPFQNEFRQCHQIIVDITKPSQVANISFAKNTGKKATRKEEFNVGY
jgi:hypothetical protein